MKPESKREGMGVTTMNCKKDEGGSVQHHSDDSTAASSSFGNTFSDHGTRGHESDNEVMSDLRGDAASMRGFGDLFPLRKKRVTSNWRKFVEPIMWRCKWVELQLRKFNSMAIMYDNEIEKHNQTKQFKYRNVELEGFCARSMPFVHDPKRQKLMKRKIRKRCEESETELYMLHHNITSYFATCSTPAGLTMDDDETNLGTSSPKDAYNEFRVPDELLNLNFRDGYSLEQILWKIEVSKSQVSKMKDRLDTVLTVSAGRISSTEDLILQESNNLLTQPVGEPDFQTKVEGPSIVSTFASQLMNLNTGHDVVKPENAASEPTHVQDANEPMEQPLDASRKRSADGILIYNRRAKKPQTASGTVKIYPIMKQQPVPEEEKNNNNATRVSVSEDSSQNEQPAPKIRSISKLTTPKNRKRRAARARRKSGSSLWSRRTSG